MSTLLTLNQLNSFDEYQFVAALDGIYEHSPWIAKRVNSQKPFLTLAALKQALVDVVTQSTSDEQLGLIRAHPELAGKAMVAKTLTAESTGEQSVAGLTHCTPVEFQKLQELNAAYNRRFGFPFILAVRGPRGTGLSRQQIIDTFARRLGHRAEFEQAEALRNIHRIAELRLNEKFGFTPEAGHWIWDCCEALAQFSEPEYKAQGQLTITYMTPEHIQTREMIVQHMHQAGCDLVNVDVLGNVTGVYYGQASDSPLLMTGSHYDTVRNAGKYDGRLGIYVPLAVIKSLKEAGKRLAIGLEVVAFAEEEGQRFKATFLGSGALTGDFDAAWLKQTDQQGVSLFEAIKAQLPQSQAVEMTETKLLEQISQLKRDASRYLGFVEVHIEQGPVLNELNLPLGVVTSINGSVRFMGEVIGMASHAGTTPMDRRRDASLAVAELALFMEQRAQKTPDTVATIGILQVPGGSINVVPGRCLFSLDIRATTNPVRDECASDVLAELAAICSRRGLDYRIEQTLKASAAPSSSPWQERWENAVTSLGLPVFKMPSGAGHDAMKLHEIMPQAMLFVRGLNSGISHNPLESTTSDDAELAVQAFDHLMHQLSE